MPPSITAISSSLFLFVRLRKSTCGDRDFSPFLSNSNPQTAIPSVFCHPQREIRGLEGRFWWMIISGLDVWRWPMFRLGGWRSSMVDVSLPRGRSATLDVYHDRQAVGCWRPKQAQRTEGNTDELQLSPVGPRTFALGPLSRARTLIHDFFFFSFPHACPRGKWTLFPGPLQHHVVPSPRSPAVTTSFCCQYWPAPTTR